MQVSREGEEMQVNASHSFCGLRVLCVMCFSAEKRKLGTQYTVIPNHFQENENTALFLSLVLSGLLTGYLLYHKN